VELELPIISINDIKNPISEQEITTMIKNIIDNKKKIETEQKSIEEKEQQKQKNIMDDKRKEKIMLVI
jgi:hypothetical protein